MGPVLRALPGRPFPFRLEAIPWIRNLAATRHAFIWWGRRSVGLSGSPPLAAACLYARALHFNVLPLIGANH